MDREESLKQLEALRKQLLKVHSCSQTCERERERIDALSEEILHPAPLSFKSEPTNAEEKLRAEFVAKNRKKILKGWGIEVLLLLICALLFAGIAAAMYFDLTKATGILIPAELGQKAGSEQMNAFYLQILMSVAAMIFAFISLFSAKSEG